MKKSVFYLLKALGILLIGILLIVLFMSQLHIELEDYEVYFPPDQEIKEGKLFVQFAGISSLYFSDGKNSILTDGFFSRPSMYDILLGELYPDTADIRWALHKIDPKNLGGIFVLHSHFDHAMDAPEVAKLSGSKLYGSLSTANIGKGWGLGEDQIEIYKDNEAINIGDFRITPILSKHYEFPNQLLKESALEGSQEILDPLSPPAKTFAYKMGGAYSLFVEHPEGSFLIHGSAGFQVDNFAHLRPDIVFLGIGGLAKKIESYQVQFFEELLDKTKVARVYPIHYDAFAGSIRVPMRGPTYLNNIMMDSKASLDVVIAAAKKRELELHLLPQWKKILLFD